ncbi:RHS repeat-associated protein [Luteibacter sp. Sphag1AF]|uniref:RHS repeat-associated core domain-containing protein n=1 Tax=Luteibacter sp. Sphag1AF TaxID=2587031 RepID=UPI0016083E35|nr:RHS repeat-associated core domain-containing protein [Luteibacter sp. Sphag1AF]MBB3228199.1 RHS repeat-associated protein [Luteibacter sp. Sphag1AF]
MIDQFGSLREAMARSLCVAVIAIAAFGTSLAAATETVTYYYTSPQGTVLATTNAGGSVISTAEYRPYGSQVLGTPEDGPGYTGHVGDVDSGLIYMQARYYDPTSARFLSIDPKNVGAGDIQSFARYSYANLNPILNIDPDGRASYALIPLQAKNINTIVTDGKGGIQVYLGNARGMGRVVHEGVDRHENTHKSDFYTNCDQTCGILADAKAGLQIVVTSGDADAAASEVRASNVEIDYLTSEKDKLRNNQEKPSILKRIDQMTEYRNDNQTIVDQAAPSPPPAIVPATPTPPDPKQQNEGGH